MARGRIEPHARAVTALALLLPFLPAPVSAYDPLDPSGNVTVVWDIVHFSNATYTVNVTIQNFQQFQRVSNWSLSWTWPGKEYIAAARGAEATAQGDCRTFILINNTAPYSCLKTPTMRDLPPLDPLPAPFPGCCLGGDLGTLLEQPQNSAVVFQVDVAGFLLDKGVSVPAPQGMSLGVPGYTCTPAFEVAPLLHVAPGSIYAVPSFQTYNVVCVWRKPEAQGPPCCVSFSSFYSSQVVPCPPCSCACGAFSHTSALCLGHEDKDSGVRFLSDGGNDLSVSKQNNSLVCSPDGCPTHIRFHFKENYEGYWRAKITVFNRMFQKNHSSWSVIMQHPNMGQMLNVYSFNYTPLLPYGINNTAAFSGIPGFNDWLTAATTQSGPGIVQSEILFKKVDQFSLSHGWPFPRKVVFMGSECALPRDFPPLQQVSSRTRVAAFGQGLVFALALTFLLV